MTPPGTATAAAAPGTPRTRSRSGSGSAKPPPATTAAAPSPARSTRSGGGSGAAKKISTPTGAEAAAGEEHAPATAAERADGNSNNGVGGAGNYSVSKEVPMSELNLNSAEKKGESIISGEAKGAGDKSNDAGAEVKSGGGGGSDGGVGDAKSPVGAGAESAGGGDDAMEVDAPPAAAVSAKLNKGGGEAPSSNPPDAPSNDGSKNSQRPVKKEGGNDAHGNAVSKLEGEPSAGSSSGGGAPAVDAASVAATANKLTASSDVVMSESSAAGEGGPSKAAAAGGGDSAKLPVQQQAANEDPSRAAAAGGGGEATPSFSMTLAIGPEDTRRVFRASGAFNAEVKRLQGADNAGGEDAAAADARGGGGDTKAGGDGTKAGPTATTTTSTEGEKKKKVPEIVHSPHNTALKNQLLPPPAGAGGGGSERTPPPPLAASKYPLPPTIHKANAAAASRERDGQSASKEGEHHKQQDGKPPSSDQPRPPAEPRRPRALRDLLLPAARSTDDALISSFLEQLERQGKTLTEKQTSLLFFLDADKSTKLLAAFDVLSGGGDGAAKGGEGKEEGGSKKGDAMDVDAADNDDDDGSSKLVGRAGLVRLFQSFLTSISTCVHGGGGAAAAAAAGDGSEEGSSGGRGNNSGGDWKGSDRTQKEILEVATFAANNLIEFAEKEAGGEGKGKPEGVGEGQEGEKEAPVGVSFDVFGKWYNSGGFSLVPWLELLDLSKWDYTSSSSATKAGDGVSSSSASNSYPTSSAKRARIQEPFTPGASNMTEPIGSPTALFASGAMLGATPQTAAKQHQQQQHGGGEGNYDQQHGGGVQSFSAMFGEMDDSRTVVSFDFSGSSPGGGGGGQRDGPSAFHIDITEENLIMLRNLVRRTGFATLTPEYVESLIMKHARAERHKHGETVYVISRAQFGKFIREVVPKESSRHFNSTEIENFSNYFTNFFTCFDYSWSDLKKDEVNAKELMVGFSFLFAGNKSSKLAAAYEMLDVDKVGYLTQRGLMQYLRSYLTMLAGISLLSANKRTTTQIRKRLMSPKRDNAFLAVENGAKWTLSHFLRSFEQEVSATQRRNISSSTRTNAVTFEDFAKWYTEGGYAVAPWLELLDLQKFLSLIGETSTGKYPPNSNDPSLGEPLFTFPLANSRHSLVVLRDDAHYVKSVVNELGLTELTSQDIWSVLYNDVSKAASEGKSGTKPKAMAMEVDQMTFVNCMMRILNGTGKIKEYSSWTDFSPEETLKNFYLSFDLAETKRVPLNQLMCGLTLLCGGKKSDKLVFAFGLFGEESTKNGKKKASMTHNDFFFFFRSFLIVMFSCCNQSLSLSADTVTQYVSDTAKSVAADVMSYWKAKNVDRVKFENFSEWYNEGGFETAPWLELLDLNKWVFADNKDDNQQQQQRQQSQEQTQQQQPIPPTPAQARSSSLPEGVGLTPGHEAIKALLATPKVKANGSPSNADFPAAPADDHLFDHLDLSAVDAEVDEMDFLLQADSSPPQGHAEHVNYVDPAVAQQKEPEPQNALKFNLLTYEQFGGYTISIGPNQVQLLHRIVTETGLCQVDAQVVCKHIIYDSKSRRQTNLTKKGFQAAMKRVFDTAAKKSPTPVSSSTQEELAAFTENLFTAFDRSSAGKIKSVAVACGFTMLSAGRKSDKLEHVFELLDADKDTLVSREDIASFIQSFLVMLMSVSSSFTHLDGGACSNESAAISGAVEAGSEWATTQVFDALQPKNGAICFDDFADWYTKGGYQSMPWLELLDLRKWVLG